MSALISAHGLTKGPYLLIRGVQILENFPNLHVKSDLRKNACCAL